MRRLFVAASVVLLIGLPQSPASADRPVHQSIDLSEGPTALQCGDRTLRFEGGTGELSSHLHARADGSRQEIITLHIRDGSLKDDGGSVYRVVGGSVQTTTVTGGDQVGRSLENLTILGSSGLVGQLHLTFVYGEGADFSTIERRATCSDVT